MEESISNMDNEKKDKNQEKLLKELFLYINEKNENNIFQDFINDPYIINNQPSLESFISQLIKQLKLGNNIIIPFLDLCPTLIKFYIDNDLDEGKDLQYIEVFKLLKINSFISKENLYPIYEYFSDIYYDINKFEEISEILKESNKEEIEDKLKKLKKQIDDKLKKFNKVFELWKIFYDFNIKEKDLKEFNSSSYCITGGGLEFLLSNNYIINDNCSLTIEIKFLNNINFDFNTNLILFEYDNEENPLKIEYNDIQELINQKDINTIIFILTENNINVKFPIKNEEKEENIIERDKENNKKTDGDINGNEIIGEDKEINENKEENNIKNDKDKYNEDKNDNDTIGKVFKAKLNNMKNFFLLKHFYGQISNIKVDYSKKNDDNKVNLLCCINLLKIDISIIKNLKTFLNHTL